ncbi:hypothetical protein FDF08_09755 [Micrococcus luteus]|nr:hypothetical protein FDF08_09755 [Micrococcus luteus]
MIVTHTTTVLRDGEPVVLLAGQHVPAWAEDLVGAHLLAESAAPAEPVEGAEPAEPVEGAEPAEPVEGAEPGPADAGEPKPPVAVAVVDAEAEKPAPRRRAPRKKPAEDLEPDFTRPPTEG